MKYYLIEDNPSKKISNNIQILLDSNEIKDGLYHNDKYIIFINKLGKNITINQTSKDKGKSKILEFKSEKEALSYIKKLNIVDLSTQLKEKIEKPKEKEISVKKEKPSMSWKINELKAYTKEKNIDIKNLRKKKDILLKILEEEDYNFRIYSSEIRENEDLLDILLYRYEKDCKLFEAIIKYYILNQKPTKEMKHENLKNLIPHMNIHYFIMPKKYINYQKTLLTGVSFPALKTKKVRFTHYDGFKYDKDIMDKLRKKAISSEKPISYNDIKKIYSFLLLDLGLELSQIPSNYSIFNGFFYYSDKKRMDKIYEIMSRKIKEGDLENNYTILLDPSQSTIIGIFIGEKPLLKKDFLYINNIEDEEKLYLGNLKGNHLNNFVLRALEKYGIEGKLSKEKDIIIEERDFNIVNPLLVISVIIELFEGIYPLFSPPKINLKEISYRIKLTKERENLSKSIEIYNEYMKMWDKIFRDVEKDYNKFIDNYNLPSFDFEGFKYNIYTNLQVYDIMDHFSIKFT